MWTSSNSQARRRSATQQHKRDTTLKLFAMEEDVRWITSMILEQAVKDLGDRNMYIRVRAHEFIMSDDFEYWAELIDLDTQAARHALKSRLEKAMKELNDGPDDVGPVSEGREDSVPD